MKFDNKKANTNNPNSNSDDNIDNKENGYPNITISQQNHLTEDELDLDKDYDREM